MNADIVLYWLIANDVLWKSDLTGEWHALDGEQFILNAPSGINAKLDQIEREVREDAELAGRGSEKSKKPIISDSDKLPSPPTFGDKGKSPPFSNPLPFIEEHTYPLEPKLRTESGRGEISGKALDYRGVPNTLPTVHAEADALPRLNDSLPPSNGDRDALSIPTVYSPNLYLGDEWWVQ